MIASVDREAGNGMPTKRTRRARHLRPDDRPSPSILRYLETGEVPAADDRTPDENPWEVWDVTSHREKARRCWEIVREDVLRRWSVQRPGRRPFAWWQYDAPKVAVVVKQTSTVPDMAAQRGRLGGTGTPSHEVLNYAPSFAFGISTQWVDAWSERYYNGRAVDIHGKRIGTEYHEGHFAGRAIDPRDPPQFESQAAYLKRLNLFHPGERERLDASAFHPALVQVDIHEDAAASIH